jgi:hypothetical protein
MPALFTQLRDTIANLNPASPLAATTIQQLVLHTTGTITTVYAPFDHLPTTARLAIVGITPGRVQAENALRAAYVALQSGKSEAEASRLAKLTASFSGTQTRNNLVAMLDAVGLAHSFAISTCAELFNPGGEQVHFTSALRYPVFVDGKNYNGSPDMVRTPVLRRMIETYLAEEISALPDALWLPLGPKPTAALQHLVRLGALSESRLLDGMPHPSGLNGERVAAFLGKLGPGETSAKTRPDKLIRARETLRERVARFSE